MDDERPRKNEEKKLVKGSVMGSLQVDVKRKTPSTGSKHYIIAAAPVQVDMYLFSALYRAWPATSKFRPTNNTLST